MSVDVAAAWAVRLALRAGDVQAWTGKDDVELAGLGTPSPTFSAGAGLIDVRPSEASVDGGQGGLRLEFAVSEADKPKWMQAQGPTPVQVWQLVKLDAGWAALPVSFEGVLGGSVWEAGRWTAEAVPDLATPRYQVNRVRWSAADQFQRTDGRDTALRRLRGTSTPVRLPERMAVPRAG